MNPRTEHRLVFFVFVGLVSTTADITVAGPFLHVFIRFAIPRKRVIRNLSAGFRRSYSAATKNGLAQRNSGTFFFRNLFDCLLQLADDQHVMKIVHIEGKEHLESALRKGRRAIPRVLDWKYPDQWNRLTVRLNKHHLDRTPDLNVSDSSDLELLPEDRKRMQCSGWEETNSRFYAWQASIEKRTC